MGSQVLNSESHDEYVCDSLELLEDEYHERESVYVNVISRGPILEIVCCRDRMADGRKVLVDWNGLDRSTAEAFL